MAARAGVCMRTAGERSGSHLDRLNWLHFKSALTPNRHSLTGEGKEMVPETPHVKICWDWDSDQIIPTLPTSGSDQLITTHLILCLDRASLCFVGTRRARGAEWRCVDFEVGGKACGVYSSGGRFGVTIADRGRKASDYLQEKMSKFLRSI